MLPSVSHDVQYVLRTLRRSPGFAAAAIAPIALGIGINTGVFSILNNVMYRPLPAPEPNELLSIYQDFRGVQKRRVHGARSMFSLAEYRAYRGEMPKSPTCRTPNRPPCIWRRGQLVSAV
jgi:hypothetical protein